jgi:Ni/Co efflux regulator RcnB
MKKTLTAIAAFSLCLATAAQAQMNQDQSQAARATLNGQQAAAAHRQLDQNAANQRDHDAAEASRDAHIVDNDMQYDAAMHAHHRNVRQYHRALRQWHEDVAACKAGHRSHCDHPMPR